MKAFLREIRVPESTDDIVHRITMVFAESMESDELYYFGTTIEAQYGIKISLEEKLPEAVLNEKLEHLKSLTGRTFKINLHKITVKELTYNHYVGFEGISMYDTYTKFEYYKASYMSKADTITQLKSTLSQMIFQGDLEGILPDGTKEELPKDFFFKKPEPEKIKLDVPYDKYPAINARYIIHEAPIDLIKNGRYLAMDLRETEVSDFDFVYKYINAIEDYRARLNQAKAVNDSLRKKIFFWEPKIVVEELALDQEFIQLAIDSVIISKEYPAECKEALGKALQKAIKQIKHTDSSRKDVRDEIIKANIELSKKYKDKKAIQLAD